MALSQSALNELLEVFRAGEGVDLIREAVRVALQDLIEAEATEVVGAARYERTEGPVRFTPTRALLRVNRSGASGPSATHPHQPPPRRRTTS